MKHALTDIPGIGPNTAALLSEHGIDSVKLLKKAGIKGLSRVPGFGEIRAAAVLNAAEALKQDKPEKARKEKKPKKSGDTKSKPGEKKKSKKGKDGKAKKSSSDKKKKGKKKKK